MGRCLTMRGHPASVCSGIVEQLPGRRKSRERFITKGGPLNIYVTSGVQLAHQEVMVAGKELRVVAPLSVDAVLDEYVRQGKGCADPYWTRVWPSAVALASTLLTHRQLVQGARVCDIGCGLGVSSIAASLAGARSVTAVDRDLMALHCACLTVQANGLDYKFHAAGQEYIASQRLRSQLVEALPVSSQVRAEMEGLAPILVQQVDWGHLEDANLSGNFEVVLACDILYEASAVAPVAAYIEKHLNIHDGHVLLVDPPRALQNRQEFIKRLTGGKLQLVLQSISNLQCEAHVLDKELRGGIEGDVVLVDLLSFRTP